MFALLPYNASYYFVFPAGEAAARETSRAVQSRREELDTLRDRYSEAKRLRDDAQEARR